MSGGSRWRRGWKFEGSAGEGVKEQGPPITQPWLVRMAKLSSMRESRPNEGKRRGDCRENNVSMPAKLSQPDVTTI